MLPFNMETAIKLKEKGFLNEGHFKKMQGMHEHFEKAQTMARGGQVQHMQDGGPVEPAPAITPEVNQDANEPQMASSFEGAAPTKNMMSIFPTPESVQAMDPAAEHMPVPNPQPMSPMAQPGQWGVATAELPPQAQNVSLGADPNKNYGSAGGDYPPNPMQVANQNMQNAYGMQQIGLSHQAEAEAAKGKEEAAVMMNASDKVANIQASRAAADKQQNDYLEGQLKKLDGQIDQYSTKKIDPQHFWANKSTGDKVLAGIGMFFGSFGQTGGNTFVDQINQNISRDIDAQAMNLQQEGNGLRQKQSLVGDMFALYKNKDAAIEASKVAALTQAELQAKSVAARYSGPEAAAKAQQLVGGIELQKQQANMQLQQTLIKMNALQNPEQYKEWLEPDQRERIVPGMQGLAVSKAGAEKVREAVADNASAQENINALLKLNEQAKLTKTVDPVTKAAIASRYNLLIGHIAKGMFSRVTENELHMVQNAAQDPSAIGSWAPAVAKSLETMALSSQEGVNAKAKAEGLYPLSEAKKLDKKGEVPPPAMGVAATKLTNFRK